MTVTTHDPTDDPADEPTPSSLAAAAWRSLVARLATYGLDILDDPADPLPNDPLVAAEALRYLLRFLAAGITVCIEHDDTETPEFGRMTENLVSWGLDNPDCLYSYTRVRGDATYRISGNRGTATHLEFQVNTGHFGDGDFMGWKAVSALSGDDLVTDENGEFELWLSPSPQFEVPAHVEPRAAHRANEMVLDDSASFLLLRQYFGDWDNERPADVVVENLTGDRHPTSITYAEMAARMELLDQWLDVGAKCWRDLSRGIRANEPAAITPFRPPSSAAGLKGQAYGMGPFRCEPNEAVILEFTPPPCRLWGLSLCDRFWQSIDFAAHMSSLNSFQSVLTDDGRFVGVISQTPPSRRRDGRWARVANWLDPAGHTEGTLAVRYLFGKHTPSPVLPTLDYRVVPLADLDDELPDDTPWHDTLGHPHIDVAEIRRRAAVTRRYRR